MTRFAVQFVELHGARLIVPTASDAETILAEMPVPSAVTIENSLIDRGRRREGDASDEPHVHAHGARGPGP